MVQKPDAALKKKLQKAIRLLLHWFYRPMLLGYLQKKRVFRYQGLRLSIPAGVFHPGFFGSTKVMARFLQGQKLDGQRVLEIGCGSGMLSLIAARKGAEAIASDINPMAVASCRENARLNGLAVVAFQSDLFEKAPSLSYDIILTNPPYYEGEPASPAQAAWYCGKNFLFFRRLFEELPEYTHSGSRIWMILSESCNLEAIGAIAGQNRYSLSPVFRASRLFEDFILFEATPVSVKDEVEKTI